jgi:hypothetical protein
MKVAIRFLDFRELVFLTVPVHGSRHFTQGSTEEVMQSEIFF